MAVTFLDALEYARRWRVSVIVRSLTARDRVGLRETHTGPETGGIHWPTRTVNWPAEAVSREDIPAFIHEVSHVLCSVQPHKIDEVKSPMLALDHAAFAYLGARDLWFRWMSNFQVASSSNPGRTSGWPDAPRAYRASLLGRSQDLARKAGLLTAQNGLTFGRVERIVLVRGTAR